MMGKLLARLLLGLLLCGGTSFAADVPSLTGAFNDPGRIISEQRRKEIISFLTEQETKTGNQIAVLVLDTIGDEPIEEYARKVFNAWGLGSAKNNNGVLVLILRKDKNVRIEVGRGLEGALPDILASRILREKGIPNFQKNLYGTGTLEIVKTIDMAIRGEYKLEEKGGSAGGILLIILIPIALFGGLLLMVGRKKRKSLVPNPRGVKLTRSSGPYRDSHTRPSHDGGPVYVPVAYNSGSYDGSSRGDDSGPPFSGGGGRSDGGGATESWGTDSGSGGGDSGGGGGGGD